MLDYLFKLIQFLVDYKKWLIQFKEWQTGTSSKEKPPPPPPELPWQNVTS